METIKSKQTSIINKNNKKQAISYASIKEGFPPESTREQCTSNQKEKWLYTRNPEDKWLYQQSSQKMTKAITYLVRNCVCSHLSNSPVQEPTLQAPNI